LKNIFLKDLRIPHPASRSEQNSSDAMVRIARAIAKLLNDSEIDRVRQESMMYAAETIDESWYINTLGTGCPPVGDAIVHNG